MDERWWHGDSTLTWFVPGMGPAPDWAPDPTEAWQRLERRRPLVLAALALTAAYRTATTRQLHALDPRLPARGNANLWLDLHAAHLIDLGFPLTGGTRMRATPTTAPFTAVRITIMRAINRLVDRLDPTPVERLMLPPGTLRGQRQAARHNLIATQLAVTARHDGWLTAGEAWCAFRRITGVKNDGDGGPDLAIIGDTVVLFIELTASTNMQLEKKFTRWDQRLARDHMGFAHVVWLDAGHGPNRGILRRLEHAVADRPRMHAGVAVDWLEHIPQPWTPGHPEPPDGWMHRDMRRIGRQLGFPNAGAWRLPARLEGQWAG